jgi:hypothetical protein
MVKPDVVTLLTVPDAPPAAGPDRALDPPPAAAVEEDVAVVEGDVAVAEGDEPQAARNTIAAHAAVAAKIHLGRDRVVLVSGGLIGFQSFMIAFSLLRKLCTKCEPRSWEGAVRRL